MTTFSTNGNKQQGSKPTVLKLKRIYISRKLANKLVTELYSVQTSTHYSVVTEEYEQYEATVNHIDKQTR